jgi:hypothetical protein
MAQLTLPAGLYPQVAGFALQQSTAQARSRFDGTLQVLDMMAERWVCSITWPNRIDSASGLMESLQNRLAGGVNELLLHHPARSQPRGTLRGTPTVQTTATRGAASLVLTVGSGMTLEAGDLFGVADQLFMTATSCAAVSTTLTVPLVNRVRSTVTSGASVVWSRPTARFRCTAQMNMTIHRPGYAEGGALDLEEVID